MPNFKKNNSKFKMKGFNSGVGTEMGGSHLYKKTNSHLTKVPFVQDDEYGKADFEGNVYAQPGGKDYDKMYKDFKAGEYGDVHFGAGNPSWDITDTNDSGSTDDEWEHAKKDIHYKEGQTTGKQRFNDDKEAFDAHIAAIERRRGAYDELRDKGYDMTGVPNVETAYRPQEEIDAMNAAEAEKLAAKEAEKLAKEKEGETLEGQDDPEAVEEYEGSSGREKRKGKRQITSDDVENAKSRWNQRRLHRKMLRQQGHSRKDARLAARAATPKRKISLGFLQKKGNRTFNN